MSEMATGLTAEMYRAVVSVVDDRIREMRVPRQDFSELKGIVRELAQAQAHTDASVKELAQAQAHTDASVKELAQAQARTDASVKELVQAQARTDASVKELAQAQARTEERVGRLEQAMERLAQAQARTEETLQHLTERVGNLSKEVGVLSQNIGFGLEDIARVMLPPYLERHYGLQLEGPLGEELRRAFFRVDSEEIEVDLYGEGRRNGENVVVVGETKSHIYGREVKQFAKVLDRVEPQVKAELWRVMFGYYIHPTATKPAEERNILLVASYQR